jgi:histone deacetylase 6
MQPFGHDAFNPSSPLNAPPPPLSSTSAEPPTINPLALRLNGPSPVDMTLGNSHGKRHNPSGWVEDPDTPMGEAGQSNGDARSTTNSTKSRKLLRPNPLKYSSKRTGICYDVRMRFHATIDEEDMHPEDPRRIFEIYKTICQAGLIDDPLFVGNVQRDDIMKLIAAREVTREEALLVHTEDHWSFLEGTQGWRPVLCAGGLANRKL